MRAAPAQPVLDCFAVQVASDLYLTTILEAELRFGVLLLPDGKRKTVPARALDEMLEEDFADRILPFDRPAAQTYAMIAGSRRREGRAVKEADCQIGTIAVSRGAALATRNGKDFIGSGVELLNPWDRGRRKA